MPVTQPEPLRRVDHQMPVTTTDGLAGRTIVKVIGEVIGAATRPKTLTDPRALVQSRQRAISSLVEMAAAADADAVVALRFATGDLGPALELVAYGTAVRLGPARATSESSVLVDDELDDELHHEVEPESSPARESSTEANLAPEPPSSPTEHAAWPFQPSSAQSAPHSAPSAPPPAPQQQWGQSPGWQQQ